MPPRPPPGWLWPAGALALLLCGCSSPQPPAWTEVVLVPSGTSEVAGAVAALPECGAVPAAGVVRWRPRVTCGSPAQAAVSCSYPAESPPRIDVAYAPVAWESALGSELCRICGYADGTVAAGQARACSARAKYGASLGVLLSPRDWQESVDPPLDTREVVAAVSALPECKAVREGGVIHWQGPMACKSLPAAGCSYPFEVPHRIEIVYTPSAWDGTIKDPGHSTLAHELCHVCGHLDEAGADACALRAQKLAGR